MGREETCGTCKWCSEEGPGYYMCVNEESENFGFEVTNTDTCEIHKSKY